MNLMRNENDSIERNFIELKLRAGPLLTSNKLFSPGLCSNLLHNE